MFWDEDSKKLSFMVINCETLDINWNMINLSYKKAMSVSVCVWVSHIRSIKY